MDFCTEKKAVETISELRRETLEQPIDCELMLPDYCPDIARVLNCTAAAKIVSKKVINGKVVLDGTVNLIVLYVEEEGGIRSHMLQMPFSRDLDAEGEEQITVQVLLGNAYLNARQQSPRKVDIHGAVPMTVILSSRHCTDIVTNAEGGGIQLKTKQYTVTSEQCPIEKYLTVNDELLLDGNQPAVRCVLRYEAVVASCDCRMVGGKAVVRGELNIAVIYCAEEKLKVSRGQITIPFSQIIDMDNAEEDSICIASADVVSVDLRPRQDEAGENRMILISAGLCISAAALTDQTFSAVTDAFSVCCETELTRTELPLRRLAQDISDEIQVRDTVAFPREIAAVLDVWCAMPSHSCTVQDNHVTVSGSVPVTLLCSDTDGSPLMVERTVEFSDTGECKEPPVAPDCRCTVQVSGAGYVLSGGTSAELRVSLAVRLLLFDCPSVPLVTAIKLCDCDRNCLAEQPAITICHAGKGDEVFGIARKYGTTVEAVTQANAIEGDVLEEDRMLVIPGVR